MIETGLPTNLTTYKPGERVQVTISGRTGFVVKRLHPHQGYRIQWDDPVLGVVTGTVRALNLKPIICEGHIVGSHPRGFSGPHLPPRRRCTRRAKVLDAITKQSYCKQHGKQFAAEPVEADL